VEAGKPKALPKSKKNFRLEDPDKEEHPRGRKPVEASSDEEVPKKSAGRKPATKTKKSESEEIPTMTKRTRVGKRSKKEEAEAELEAETEAEPKKKGRKRKSPTTETPAEEPESITKRVKQMEVETPSRRVTRARKR